MVVDLFLFVKIIYLFVLLLLFNVFIAAFVLDRLVKDVVVESEIFNIEVFISTVQKHIKKTKPYIRQLIVGKIYFLYYYYYHILINI